MDEHYCNYKRLLKQQIHAYEEDVHELEDLANELLELLPKHTLWLETYTGNKICRTCFDNAGWQHSDSQWPCKYVRLREKANKILDA